MPAGELSKGGAASCARSRDKCCFRMYDLSVHHGSISWTCGLCENRAVPMRCKTIGKNGQYGPGCMELNRISYLRRSLWSAPPEMSAEAESKKRARERSPRPIFPIWV